MSQEKKSRQELLDEAIKAEQEKRRKMREKHLREQKMQRTFAIVAILFVVLLGVMTVVRVSSKKKSDKANEGSSVTTEALSTENTANDDILLGDDFDALSNQIDLELATNTDLYIEPKEVKLIAIGDDLVHKGVYNAGLLEDGSHDYTVLFQGITSYLQDADLKIINQETIFGGEGTELSSYPVFNSPEAIGDAVAEVGFNVVLHATNHAMDMGSAGILNTIDFWRNNHPDVTMIGLTKDESEEDIIPTRNVNGITFALLNYTYSHNWETFSEGAEGHLNMLCEYDPETRYIDFNTLNPKVLEDIKKAEELADFTIVFPHWGTEYVLGTTEQQDNFAKQMVECGADLIIGGHPHVIEPVKWIETSNGNRALCYFSLGNFTSTQDLIEGLIGGMASLTIRQDAKGTYVDEESIKAIPVITHYQYPGWTGGPVVQGTYTLGAYTDEQAAANGLYPRCGIVVTREKIEEIARSMFGEYFSLE